ncbi:MAG: ABC transporter permease [Erysipelotrichales bacterium]|nr:ABC transporter permease [Erysipelotrichales bacterium]
MVIGIKAAMKLIGISIIACCAVFVCTLFLNYNIDIVAMKSEIITVAGVAMYNAQVSTGKVVSAVSGGCLVMTSIVMLMFYIKNYIDAHSKELGILKALGYSNVEIAKHFWVFGLSVFIGCTLGYLLAFFYLPSFYALQNAEHYFPEINVHFHPLLTFCLVGVPSLCFTALAIIYAYFKLKQPVFNLLKEKREYKTKVIRKETKDISFLKDLTINTIRSRKTFVFFIAFSAFCFSAMVQMSMSMKNLSSETMAIMIISIGLILAFTTLLLSLSSVVKENTKTIAMMMVFGYKQNECSKAVLGGYRPFSYFGFILGTIYQYVLLKIMVTVVFVDVENVPEYNFDFKMCVITLIIFILTYELVMYAYSRRIQKLSIKSVMLE